MGRPGGPRTLQTGWCFVQSEQTAGYGAGQTEGGQIEFGRPARMGEQDDYIRPQDVPEAASGAINVLPLSHGLHRCRQYVFVTFQLCFTSLIYLYFIFKMCL